MRVRLKGKHDRSLDALAMPTTAWCSGCQDYKPVEEFGLRVGTVLRVSTCHSCRAASGREYMKDNIGAKLYYSAKQRAKSAGIDFDLDRDDIMTRTAKGCELTGIPFERGEGRRVWNSPSLDRINAKKGYTKGNVRVVLWCLNMAFANWGENQFEIVARAWLERKSFPC